MKVRFGDIWEVANPLDLIVVPTNVGYTKDGNNVMGRGIARQAAQDDPSLPLWYGAQCKKFKERTPIMSRGRFILFPTKPFRAEAPWLSWMQIASLDTIETSLQQLKKYVRADKRSKILIPLVGTGNGKLKEHQVMPLLRAYWMRRYRLIRRKR